MPKKRFKIDVMQAHTLSWWRSRRDEIDMDPPYQRRGRLWSLTDKAYLIDSILNGYDIPKFYIADFTWGSSALNRKKLPYAIIDGKQRFEAIFDFYDGGVFLNDDFTYLANTKLSLAGLGYKDLIDRYPQIAESFDQYNLMVMAVVASSEEPIDELFVRLNRSKPLTGAEIRNAMRGPAPGIIRRIAEHNFFQICGRFQMKRAQDKNAAAKLLLFEYENGPAETKKSRLDQFVHDASHQPKERLELAARKTIDTLDRMEEIFLPKDILLSSAGQVPLFYWLVRMHPEADDQFIREFLVKFERERKNNRNLVQSNPQDEKIDRRLLEYDQFNRNTNDLASHDGRIRILEERLAGFVKAAATKQSKRSARVG
jgi:Protein of unknown function DUF262